MLAGCGGSNPPIEESSSVEEPAPVIELTEENSMEITFVNASDCPVQKLTAWWAGQNEGFDLLHNLDRNLEPDEVIRLRIPRSEDNYYSIGVTEAEYCYTFFPGWSFEYIPEGGIMVLLAGEYPEGYEDIQTIFEAGTDVETAKGIRYSLNQEKYLRVFLTDSQIPMDNNMAEQAIRPFCVGKKNWKLIDTVHGAQVSAIWKTEP